ncbi:hypothetical protein ACLLJJ_00750 [Streptomyces sp. A5-4]
MTTIRSQANRSARRRPSASTSPVVGGRWSSRTAANLLVAVSVLYALLPLVWLLMASTADQQALFASDFFDPSNFALLDNIRALMAEGDGIFLRWYGNSLLYAVGGAALGAIVSVSAGYNAAAPIVPDYYPLMVIGSLLALLPLVIAFVLLQRLWKSGLTAGAVK